jgi:hypothetical protein
VNGVEFLMGKQTKSQWDCRAAQIKTKFGQSGSFALPEFIGLRLAGTLAPPVLTFRYTMFNLPLWNHCTHRGASNTSSRENRN